MDLGVGGKSLSRVRGVTQLFASFFHTLIITRGGYYVRGKGGENQKVLREMIRICG